MNPVSERLITGKTILLVDDSEDDIALMRRAFKKAEFNSPIQEVHNGEEAIAYLKGEGAYSDRNQFPLPAIVLLDLNMPMKNGFEVLAQSLPLLSDGKAAGPDGRNIFSHHANGPVANWQHRAHTLLGSGA
jgi:response regulator RpfG family c-di-GMP phosphodiesterase